MTAAPPILSVQRVGAGYRQFRALHDVSFDIPPGIVHGIIGPNGAGKSTLIDVMTGFHRPNSGVVRYAAVDLARTRPYRVARLGVRRTFQHPRLCWQWSVLDNVMSGAGPESGRDAVRDRARAALERVGIAGAADEPCGSTDGVTQLRTQIARCLVASPTVLLLDEPSAGMDDAQAATLAELLRGLCDAGMTVLLVAHDLSLIRSTCARVTVLNFGELIADGETDDVLARPAVLSAYMGVSDE